MAPKTNWERRLLAAWNIRQDQWDKYAKEVADHFDGVDEAGMDLRHFYNKHLAADRNMMAAVAPQRIEVEATAENPEHMGQARTMEQAVRHNFVRAKLREISRDWIYYGFEWGVGILYTQWGRSGSLNPVIRPDGQAGIGKPTERRDSPADDPHPEAAEAIRQAMPGPGMGDDWCKYFVIPPKQFLLSPEATHLQSAYWAGHWQWIPRQQVEQWAERGIIGVKKSELQYRPLFEEGQSGDGLKDRSSQMQSMMEAWHEEDAAEGRELWQIVHVFDFVENKYRMLLPGMPKPLIERANHLGNPYAEFRPASTPRAFWSKPPAWSYLQTNHTLDDVIETLVDYAARFGKTVGVFSEEEDTELLKKFAESQGAEFFQARNPEAFKAISLSDLPAALLNLVPILNQLITETSGMSEVSSGVVSKGEVTATEIERNVAFQSLRLRIIKQVFDDSLQHVAERTAFLLATFKTQRSMIPLLGLDVKHWQPEERESLLGEDLRGGGASTMTVGPDNLNKGMQLFTVRAGDSAEEQKLADRKQAMDLLTILMPNAAMMGINLLPLLQRILEMLGLDSKLILQGASPAPPMGAPVETGGVGRPMERSQPVNQDQMDRGGIPTDGNAIGATRRAS